MERIRGIKLGIVKQDCSNEIYIKSKAFIKDIYVNSANSFEIDKAFDTLFNEFHHLLCSAIYPLEKHLFIGTKEILLKAIDKLFIKIANFKKEG